MSSERKLPSVMKFGAIVYSDQFYGGILKYPIDLANPEIYGTKVGIIISTGRCGNTITSTVAFYDSKGEYNTIKFENLAELKSKYSIQLHDIGMKITDSKLDATKKGS